MTQKNSIGIDASLVKNAHFVNGVLKKFWILSSEAGWVFFGQAGTAIAGLVGIKLLTHVLDPSEFGRLALANTIMALIGINFFGPFGQGLMRYWAISKDRGGLDAFCAVANRLAKHITLVTLSITVICFFILSLLRNLDWAILVTLSLLIGVSAGFLSLRTSIFTAARQRQRTAILNISNAFLRPLVATALVLLVVANANVALVGYLLAALFLLFITERLYSQITWESSPYHFKFNPAAPLFRTLRKEIISYSWPFLIWGIFGWIHMSCDRWSLQTFHGSGVVGSFAIVSLLATYPLNLGSDFLIALFSPIAFQRAGDLTNTSSLASANRILALTTVIYILGAALLIGFFAFSYRTLILFVSNESFSKFSHLLPALTIAWGFFFLGQILTQFGLLFNRPNIYIMPKITSSLLAAATTFYLSPRTGPVGVICGLAIAGVTYAAWCFIIAFKLNLSFQKSG